MKALRATSVLQGDGAARRRTTPEVDAVTAAPARAFGVGETPPENRYDDGDDDRTYTDSPLKTVEIKTYM